MKQIGLNVGEIFKLRKRRLIREETALYEKLKLSDFRINQIFLRIKTYCKTQNDYFYLTNSLKPHARNS